MTEFIQTRIQNQIAFLTLDRPRALNSLSLDMVRALSQSLREWQNNPAVRAVVVHGSNDKAFCAGGDIRFFHDAGNATPRGGSALLEDFFTEEYALNHLIHHYPKPYIALMDGIVMGGGMGVAQAGAHCRLRIVTERTKMAMPEVNIGLFPDVGGGFFLSRAPGEIGTFLGVTGETITAADALYAELADLYVPAAQLPALMALLESTPEPDLRTAVRMFAAPFQTEIDIEDCRLARQRAAIDRHFASDQVAAIVASLTADDSVFAQQTLAVMQKRSPLMMCVTLAQLRRAAHLNVADCLRLERTMVRRCFEHGEVLEGVRALVIDKDNAPRWQPPTLDQVTPEMVDSFFAPAWPAAAHPLRDLH